MLAGVVNRWRQAARRVARAPDWQIVLAACGCAALCEVDGVATSVQAVGDALRTLATAAAFLIAGLIARRRQPDNRTGILLVLTCFAFLFEDLRDSNVALAVTV